LVLGRRSDSYQLIAPESVAVWVASKFDDYIKVVFVVFVVFVVADFTDFPDLPYQTAKDLAQAAGAALTTPRLDGAGAQSGERPR
jgi:hypothetical protein